MPAHVPVGPLHHLRLTVTDIERSRQFHTRVPGFQVAVQSPPPGDPSGAGAFRILFGGVVMVRGDLLMGLPPMAPDGDRFDPDRAGLDHLSFSVASRDDLAQAVRLFDEQGVPHGTITRLPSSGIDVLPFEDPDGVQLELTAPADQPAPQGWPPGPLPQRHSSQARPRSRRSARFEREALAGCQTCITSRSVRDVVNE
jgi:catechol 2,3-dioxygenase-like lactoylglutathione lyase family enzyme